MPPFCTIRIDPKQRRLADFAAWSTMYHKFPQNLTYNMQIWSWRFWAFVNEPEVSQVISLISGN